MMQYSPCCRIEEIPRGKDYWRNYKRYFYVILRLVDSPDISTQKKKYLEFSFRFLHFSLKNIKIYMSLKSADSWAAFEMFNWPGTNFCRLSVCFCRIFWGNHGFRRHWPGGAKTCLGVSVRPAQFPIQVCNKPGKFTFVHFARFIQSDWNIAWF